MTGSLPYELGYVGAQVIGEDKAGGVLCAFKAAHVANTPTPPNKPVPAYKAAVHIHQHLHSQCQVLRS
jgi:hypothetical protein